MRIFINSLMLWFIIAAAGAEAASLSETIVEAIKSSSSTEAPSTTKAPSSTEVCQQDALTCADGSVLSRDPDLNCKFPRCSCGDSSECRRGECLEGYCKDVPDEVDDDDDGGDDDDDDGDDGDDDKSDDYEPSLCIQDVQECLDGSAVGRVPPYCEFEACPCSGSRDCYFGDICDSGKCMEDDRDSSCPLDTLECIDGSFVSRVPPACKFDRCSCSTSRECRRGVCFEGKCSDRSVQCTTDVKECDDGSVVGRVPPAW